MSPTAENGAGTHEMFDENGHTVDDLCTEHSKSYTVEAKKVTDSDGAFATGHMARGRTDAASPIIGETKKCHGSTHADGDDEGYGLHKCSCKKLPGRH